MSATEILAPIAIPLGVVAAGSVLVLSAELEYRWHVHSMQKKSFPHEQHESFVKYLFMAWFVRNKAWYEKQRK